MSERAFHNASSVTARTPRPFFLLFSVMFAFGGLGSFLSRPLGSLSARLQSIGDIAPDRGRDTSDDHTDDKGDELGGWIYLAPSTRLNIASAPELIGGWW
jgi:hypothetical protein